MKKLVIALTMGAAVAAAAHSVTRLSSDEVFADSLSTQTQWLCRECDHAFMLTAQEVMDQAKRNHTAIGASPLQCAGCGVRQAFRARICETCGGAFFGLSVPGSTGECPRCGKGSGPAVLANHVPVDLQSDSQSTDEQKRKIRETPIQAH
jgi:hypothetical protein